MMPADDSSSTPRCQLPDLRYALAQSLEVGALSALRRGPVSRKASSLLKAAAYIVLHPEPLYTLRQAQTVFGVGQAIAAFLASDGVLEAQRRRRQRQRQRQRHGALLGAVGPVDTPFGKRKYPSFAAALLVALLDYEREQDDLRQVAQQGRRRRQQEDATALPSPPCSIARLAELAATRFLPSRDLTAAKAFPPPVLRVGHAATTATATATAAASGAGKMGWATLNTLARHGVQGELLVKESQRRRQRCFRLTAGGRAMALRLKRRGQRRVLPTRAPLPQQAQVRQGGMRLGAAAAAAAAAVGERGGGGDGGGGGGSGSGAARSATYAWHGEEEGGHGGESKEGVVLLVDDREGGGEAHHLGMYVRAYYYVVSSLGIEERVSGGGQAGRRDGSER